MILIGISGKKLSGKDALCTALLTQYKQPGARVAFADALKREVAIACGVSRNFIEQNKTQFRPILQWWGTDFRRHFQGDDYWVKQGLQSVKDAADLNLGICVIPDVRFKSEVAVLKEIGAYIVRIARPSQLIDSHISETELDDYKGFDHIVINNGSLKDLDDEAVVILNKIKQQTK